MSHAWLTERSLVVAGAAIALLIVCQALRALQTRSAKPKSLSISEVQFYLLVHGPTQPRH